MKVANGLKIDNEEYILASAVSATYAETVSKIKTSTGVGDASNAIYLKSDGTFDTCTIPTIPAMPAFSTYYTYVLACEPNASNTGYEYVWKKQLRLPHNLPLNTLRIVLSEDSDAAKASLSNFTYTYEGNNVFIVTAKSNDFSNLFKNNTYLVDVLEANTSGVTTMYRMFYGCTSLTSVPQFDTSSVTTMYCMFTNCTSLTSVPQFDTSSVTTMTNMFYDCKSLTSVPQFDTSSVTTMYCMFTNCTSLTSVPQFDTSSVTNMRTMFLGCSKVQSGMLALYTAASSTGKVTSYIDCFTSCGTSGGATAIAERAQIPASWGGDKT